MNNISYQIDDSGKTWVKIEDKWMSAETFTETFIQFLLSLDDRERRELLERIRPRLSAEDWMKIQRGLAAEILREREVIEMVGDYYRVTIKPKGSGGVVYYTWKDVDGALASASGLFHDNRLLEFFEIKAVDKVPDGETLK